MESPGTTASVGENEGEDEEEEDEDTLVPELKEGQSWTLINRSSINAAAVILKSTSVRPIAVCVQGGQWCGQSLQDFLALLSHIGCGVLVQTRDTFWTPGDNTIQTTRDRIQALVKPSQR